MDKCLLCEQIQPQNIENIYTEQQIQLVKDLTNMIVSIYTFVTITMSPKLICGKQYISIMFC